MPKVTRGKTSDHTFEGAFVSLVSRKQAEGSASRLESSESFPEHVQVTGLPLEEEFLMREEVRTSLDELRQTLSPKQAQVMLLSALDLTQEEIARMLCVSVGAVKHHRHMARKKLEKLPRMA